MTRAAVRVGPGPVLGLAAVLALWTLTATAQAAERVALVIGNADYEHVPDLVNPKKDAVDVGAALARLGFAVTSLDNVGKQDLERGLQKFEEEAARSKIAVVFYAGHGIEMNKYNYLVPVNAKLKTDMAVSWETIPLDRVIGTVQRASTLGMVILDACRDNPFLAEMRSTGLKRLVGRRGLARVELPEPQGTGKSTLVAYSAQEGTTAADGAPGGNSPYAEALLKHLETPGLHVGDLFIAVRQEVLAKPGSQRPVEYASLVEKVYLASAGAPLPKVPATPTAGVTSPLPSGDAARAYEAAERLNTVAAYRIVVEDFPGTTYAKLAQGWIDKHEGKPPPIVVAGGDGGDDVTPVVPPPVPDPEEVELGLGLSVEARRLVQMGLAAAGHDPGKVDGMLGGKTRRALKAWQASKEVEGTGYLTREQSEALVALGKWEEERRKKPGTTFEDCPECPEMVVVPAGEFMMGSPPSEKGRDGDEGPVHRVTIAEPFAVGKYEVTFEEWDACVSGGGCGGHRPGDEGWGRGSRPAINVSWEDARAYVDWLSRKTGEDYRLLSEAEWEYVARAGTTGPYHFGSSLSPSQANYGDNSGRHGSGRELFGECVRAL